MKERKKCDKTGRLMDRWVDGWRMGDGWTSRWMDAR